MSFQLIDFLNPSELFLAIFALVVCGILIFINLRKRRELIKSIRPYFSGNTNKKTLIQMLSHFQELQQGYRKSINRQLLIFYGLYLLFYFMFLYGYYRIGAVLTGLLEFTLAFVVVNLIYKRKIS
jgi:drug/metabolite transporter (DMT)-like permease